jgi:hypothetical protein
LRHRGRQVPFSFFALPDSFSTVPRPSGLVLKFFAPGHIFGGTEGVRSRFHVLRSLTRFQQYRGRRGSISCFALTESFWALPWAPGPVFLFCAPGLISTVPRASGLVFMFCAPDLFLCGTEGVGAHFQVFCSPTHFQQYLGRRGSISCFELPD